MAKNAIVVEISQKTMSAIEIVNRNNGVELLRYTIRDIPAAGVTSTWLKAVWHQEHFSQNRVILCLPDHMVFFKKLNTPILPLPELEKVVKLELASTNGRSEDINRIFSYQKQDQLYEVTVAVIANQPLNEMIQFLQQSGVEVYWSGLRTQGIRNFINFNLNFMYESTAGLSYLDFSDEQIEFGIICEEKLVYQRELGYNLLDLLTDNVEITSDFIEELRLSIAAYQAESGNQAPLGMEIIGKTEAVPFIKNYISEQLELKMNIPENSKLTGVITHKHTPVLAPLIGLALDQFGLFNQPTIQIHTLEQEHQKNNRHWILMGIGIGLITLFLGSGLLLGMQANIQKEERITEWLSSKAGLIDKLHSLERQTKLNTNKVRQLETWLSGRGRELDFLLVLDQNLPPGTRISDILIEDGIVKDLSGITPSASVLLNKLNSVPELSNLKLKGTITASAEGESFQLEGVIPGKEPAK